MVIADETDEEAMAKWQHYRDGADLEALSWMVEQATADKASGTDSGVHQAIIPELMVNLNMGLLIGSTKPWPSCSTRWRRFPAWRACC